MKRTSLKKGLVTLVSVLMMVSVFGAIESNDHGNPFKDFYYYDDVSIEFKEKGIKFYVFLDGSFDFNIAPSTRVDYIYKSGRRSNRHYVPRGVRIERDYQGRIRRVGNVFINYTWDDKIKQIGSVFVKYNHNRMKKVGNLKIVYNPHRIRLIGHVKGHSSYNPYYSYSWRSYNDWHYWDTWEYGYYDSFFYGDVFFNNYERFDEDDSYYYYRSKRIKNQGKKGKIIKRKKAKKSKRTEMRKKGHMPDRIISKHKKRKS